MRCGQSLQNRCMPGVGRSKIQPRRPRIREVLGRSVAPVATQPDDKRAGGRVELTRRLNFFFLNLRVFIKELPQQEEQEKLKSKDTQFAVAARRRTPDKLFF